MDRPSPFTLIVQTLSALLGGVWARLFLGRAEAAAMQEMVAAFRALEELYADWRAGKLACVPESIPVRDAVAQAADGAVRRPRTRRVRTATCRRRIQTQARPRRIGRRPVNWSFIPDWIGPLAKRRSLAVPRLAEWSG